MLKIKRLFEEATVPIDLPDDGLRLRDIGRTISGNFHYTTQENPSLVADVLAIRRERRLIQAHNERKWA